MASVVDYASLNQAVQDWLKRSDMAGYIDYFIQSAEDRIYDDLFALNQGRGVLAIETAFPSSQVIAANGTYALSNLTGYLGMKEMNVTIGQNVCHLERRTTEFIYSQFPDRTASDAPAYYAREGQSFIFGPFPDSQYTLNGTYWARSNPLSGTNTTTWMVTNIPSALLAACCAAAALFLKDSDALQIWDSLYSRQLLSYINRDKMEELSGTSLAMVAS